MNGIGTSVSAALGALPDGDVTVRWYGRGCPLVVLGADAAVAVAPLMLCGGGGLGGHPRHGCACRDCASTRRWGQA
jgi:hypothetical protein